MMDPKHMIRRAFLLKMAGCPYESWTAKADEWWRNFLAQAEQSA